MELSPICLSFLKTRFDPERRGVIAEIVVFVPELRIQLKNLPVFRRESPAGPLYVPPPWTVAGLNGAQLDALRTRWNSVEFQRALLASIALFNRTVVYT